MEISDEMAFSEGKAPMIRSMIPILVLAVALLGSTGPLGAQEEPDEERLRGRDLQVFEDLLEASVEEAVRTRLSRHGDDGELVVRVDGEGWARGIFLEDFGVFFALQLPRIPMVSRFLSESLAARRKLQLQLVELERRAARLRASMAATDDDGREATIRSRLEELSERIDDLRGRLSPAVGLVEVSPESEDRVAARGQSVSAVAARDSDSGASTEGQSGSGASAEGESGSSPSAEADRESGSGDLRESDRADDPESRRQEIRRLNFFRAGTYDFEADRAAAEERRREIVTASTDAVIETLARYARVIHGLEEDDRIAVILLPAAAGGFWPTRDARQSREHVISVRFGDVVEFDRGDLSREEFDRRVVVHGRTGEPIDLDPSQ